MSPAGANPEQGNCQQPACGAGSVLEVLLASVEKMEEKVKKETRIFSTSALQKLKERKHKRPPEEKKHQE